MKGLINYKNNCLKFLAFFGIALLFFSCRDENLLFDEEVPRQDNLPVVLDVNIMRDNTRSPSYFKKEFETNDVIHLQGVFHISDGTTITKYAAMKYNGEKWLQYSGATETSDVPPFTWPNNAITADFTAYFIFGSNSLMVPVESGEEVTATLLSNVAGTSVSDPDKDPLKASTLGVKYGHTIVLDFIHACAYLTVEEMAAGVSRIFWFTQESNGGETTFNNAFRCYLNTDNQLIFEFVPEEDPAYGNIVYVQGTATTAFVGSTEKASASFFLPPGKYTNFVVGYPGSNSMVTYFTYTKQVSSTPGTPVEPGEGGTGDGSDSDIENNDPSKPSNPNNLLQANGVYTFNVSKSKGVVINSDITPDEWDEGDDPIYDVDAEKFLWAVCKCENYFYDDNIQILKGDGSSMSQLLHNVNMQYQEYTVFAPSDINGQTWFEPSIGQGVTFDGGLHYIWNLGSPLFLTNNGTIKNLGIANANVNGVTMDEYVPEDFVPTGTQTSFDLSRQGALCGYLDKGTIENIRIKAQKPIWDVNNKYIPEFNVNIQVYGIDSQESHNIGGLIGSNGEGTVNNVSIRCPINLNVSNYTGENGEIESHVPRTYIGGIVGQNVKEMHNVYFENDSPVITITNSCYYINASYSIGGVVGLFSGGTINNFYIPNVIIDSQNSEGFTSYIGGFAGRLSNVEVGGRLTDCQIGGSVYSGKCNPNQEGVPGSSYIGGLAGDIYESYLIDNNFVNVNVSGYQGSDDNGSVSYSTGGMFGVINNLPGETPDKIRNNIAIGRQLSGAPIYIGNFAGMVPADETWEDNYEPNGNRVSMHQMDGVDLKNIGNE